MRTIGLTIVAASALFATSCISSSSGTGGSATLASIPAVVGKWRTPTGGTIEFKADGSATMAGPTGSREVQYRVVSERTIEISKPGGSATIRWQIVSLDGQELVVKDVDGAEIKLRREG